MLHEPIVAPVPYTSRARIRRKEVNDDDAETPHDVPFESKTIDSIRRVGVSRSRSSACVARPMIGSEGAVGAPRTAAALLAISTEASQLFTLSRHPSMGDVSYNLIGA